jgi:hypothetical protein
MKDFDQERAIRTAPSEDERTFVLAGESFTIRASVRADTLAHASDVTADSKVSDDVAAFDALIEGFLEEHDRPRYRLLRARETDPVTFDDLMEVAAWMVSVNSGRPTQQASPSTAGPERTGTTLTAVSSQPPAAQEA